MNTDRDIQLYFETIVNIGLYPKKNNLKFQMETLFRGIDFKNKTFLDIGSGIGLYSFYAYFKGSEKVICLEPESDGSSQNVINRFHKLKKILKCDAVNLEQVTFQEFDSNCNAFDIILLHDSINHLDEEACINLLRDNTSLNNYKKIFLKLNSLLKTGGKIIICDCSNRNFFHLLKIRNPFVPMIDWNKHQSPDIWADLMSKAGFLNPRIQWSSFNRLGFWGRVFLSNKIMSFFLTSHFCLTMDKS